MKPSKTIREMDSSKLLKAFEIEVNEYGGKRFDCLGNIMPRYNQNKIKMMRTELFRRLGLVKEDSYIPTLNDDFFASVDKSIEDKLTMKYGEVIESPSNDEYIKHTEESNKKIKSESNYMNELLKKYGRNR